MCQIVLLLVLQVGIDSGYRMVFMHFLLNQNIGTMPSYSHNPCACDRDGAAPDQRLCRLILLPDAGHTAKQPPRNTSNQAWTFEDRLRMKACKEYMMFRAACKIVSFHTAVQCPLACFAAAFNGSATCISYAR